MPLASLGPSYVGVLPDACDWKNINIIERSQVGKKVRKARTRNIKLQK